MDDLKNVVIQSLEDEGTLGSLRAQLRSRVFKAIEKHADTQTKQSAGFQWQNPIASKIHENEESLLAAHLVREYLEFYRMEYTLSVMLPELALQNTQCPGREDLSKKAQIVNQSGEGASVPLLVQLLRANKESKQKESKEGAAQGASDNTKAQLDSKQDSASNQANVLHAQSKQSNKEPSMQVEINEEIEEDIQQEQQQLSNRDPITQSGQSTSLNAIDQSINSLKIDEYDYVEEVKLN